MWRSTTGGGGPLFLTFAVAYNVLGWKGPMRVRGPSFEFGVSRRCSRGTNAFSDQPKR